MSTDELDPDDRRKFMPAVDDDLPLGERPMVAVVHARKGHEESLASAVATLAMAVRREPGCREFRPFRPFRSIAEPGVFYLYEVYDNVDAFRVHLTLDHVVRFFIALEAHSTSSAQAVVQLEEVPTG